MPIDDEALDSGLRRLGYTSFRPGQREAIEALIEHERLLLVAPTGGGKSLTYQLPATLLPGTTLVVSPLIALMHDQVRALEERGVSCTYLASTLDGDEIRVRMARMAEGAYDLVYVAPERLAHAGFRGLVRDTACSLVAIDEAHCISEWGHDFRPEYMLIGEFLAELSRQSEGPPRVLACTATATPVVRDEILGRLGLGPETPQIVQGFARPNLRLRAREVSGKKEREQLVDEQLREALGGPHETGTARGELGGAVIVYSPTRKKTEAEAERLMGQGWRVACYHAGLSARLRDQAQANFSRGKVQVVVATNAFGMGIDRADVRAVIHLAPPGSIEAYYQEVGRAGRDGETAYGLLLTSSQDLPLRRRLLEREIDDRTPDPVVVEHKWNMFLELMRWVEGGSCRHDAILRYFGDEAEVLGGCGQCDVCEAFDDDDAPDADTVSLIVRKALSGVARCHARYGMTTVAKLLRGAADERLSRVGLDQVSTFGVLSEHGEQWIVRLLRRCVTAGWVTYTGTERPMVILTDEGHAVMTGKRPARLLLPAKKTMKTRGSSGTSRGTKRPVPDELDDVAASVFEALRVHRLDVARAEGVPPYVVASDRTLRDVAILRPRDMTELLMAHGIGPAKAEKYGEGLLSVVAQH